MRRHSVGVRSTLAASATIPLGSLYAVAANGGILRELGVFNTTAVAVAVALQRLTTTGTQGAGLDELQNSEDGPSPAMQAFQAHTVGPTITAGFFRRAVLGAAIGSGVIWTFGGAGLVIAPATTNGIGITTPDGTGQICDWYAEWEE